MRLRHIFIFICIFFSILSHSALAEVAGEWRIHPGADMYSGTGYNNTYINCVKILDTERYTYTQVLQQLHDGHQNFPDFNGIYTSVYRFDKMKPEDGMRPLSALYEISGFDVECMNYSFEGKYLAVAYKNGAIDVIFDDGRFVECNGIVNYTNPVDKEINSITTDIDGKRFYVATNFGFVCIDAETGDNLSIWNDAKPYTYACRVGEKIILFDKSTVYTVNIDDIDKEDAQPELLIIDSNFSAAKYVNSDYSLKYPDMLCPMSDKSFMYLAGQSTSFTDNPGCVMVTFRNDGNPGMAVLTEESIWYTHAMYNERFQLKSKNEGFITPTSDGILYVGSVNLRLFSKSQDIDFSKSNYVTDISNRIVKSISKNSLPNSTISVPIQVIKAASYDGENLCFFYPREGFKHFRYENGAFVKTDLPAIMPDAPAIYRASAFDYNPATGMLVRNVGEELGFGTLGNQSDGLSEYKDGEWTYHGFDKTYPTYRSRAILPHGVAIDPNNPKYVYSGSRYYGLLRMNLEDPSDFLQLSRSNSGNINKPGFVAAHEPSKEWGNLSCFGRPMFDNDCTLWTSFLEFDTYYAEQPLSNIWFWTAEDRTASEKASQDPSLYEPMGVIKVPTGSVTADSNIYVFKEEQNDNLIGFVPNGWFDGFVLDHNGTPKDTSDDKIAYLTDIYDDQTGEKLLLRYPTCMFEDTYDNSILVAYYDGILVTTREKLFDSERKTGHFMKTSDDDDEQPGVVIAQTSLTGIAVDAQNRKWLATEGSGLFCVSADRKHILDQFTIDNSKLPSDNCLGVFFNPETQSVWTGTDAGLVEFVPTGSEGSKNTYSAQAPKAMPEFVEPGYHGYIRLTNLIDNKSYDIVGPDGNVVMTAKPESGAIQVHAFGLEKGEYEVRANGAQEKVIGFTVM